MITHPQVGHIEDYQPLIGAEAVERILEEGQTPSDLHVVNVNSTC